MGLDTKIYWLTDRQSQCDFDFDLRSDEQFRAEISVLGRRRTEEVQNSQKWSCKFVITVVIIVNIQINRDQIENPQLITVAET
jgi:hypothetical protein